MDRIMNDRMIGGRWICSRLDRIGAKRRKTAAGSPKGERNESICKKDRRNRKGLDKINRIGAERRKTAVGSPKGEQSESINRI